MSWREVEMRRGIEKSERGGEKEMGGRKEKMYGWWDEEVGRIKKRKVSKME